MNAPFRRIQWTPKTEDTIAPSPEPLTKPINFSTLYLSCSNKIDEKEIPKRVVVNLDENYNILELDLIIKKRFDILRATQLPKLKKELEQEVKKLVNRLSLVEKKAIERKKEELEREIKKWENNEEKLRYIVESDKYIDAYRNLRVMQSQPGCKVFNSIDKKPNEIQGNQEKTFELITRYLNVARRYIELDIIQLNTEREVCPSCNNKAEDFILEENGNKKCSHCGYEKIIFSHVYVPKDAERQGPPRNGYDDRDTFYKGLLEFQGKQPNRLPPDLMEKLDVYFTRCGLHSGMWYRENMPLENGVRKGTSCAMLEKALSSLNLSNYYNDINLIAHLYWGWQLPDISHLEEIIMKDYDLTQKVLRALDSKHSSLNRQYRRYKHLELRGFKCNPEFFRMIKTRETLEACENKWKAMCEGAGLTFIPTI